MKKLIYTALIIIASMGYASAQTIISGKRVLTLSKAQITYLRSLNRTSITDALNSGITLRNTDVGDYILNVLTINHQLSIDHLIN